MPAAVLLILQQSVPEVPAVLPRFQNIPALSEVSTVQFFQSHNRKIPYRCLTFLTLSGFCAPFISSALGVKLDKLFTASEEEKTLSGKTLQHYHRLISSIMSTAVQWQVIATNPCDRVKPPKAERREAEYLDETQAVEMLLALENEPLIYKTLFTLILYSGMRRGEACGLEWSDIDLDNGIVDINKSSLYLPKKGIYDDDTKKQHHAELSASLPLPLLYLKS